MHTLTFKRTLAFTLHAYAHTHAHVHPHARAHAPTHARVFTRARAHVLHMHAQGALSDATVVEHSE